MPTGFVGILLLVPETMAMLHMNRLIQDCLFHCFLFLFRQIVYPEVKQFRCRQKENCYVMREKRATIIVNNEINVYYISYHESKKEFFFEFSARELNVKSIT
jgi:hypothetical protein